MPLITLSATEDDRRIAAFASLAIAMHVVEAAFPSPLPGVKPGLANVVTLVALQVWGWRSAAWISGLRVVVGALVTGNFLGPGFVLSCAGAVAALLALAVARRLPGVSIFGLSVVAALAHMASQFGVAYVWLIPHPGMWHLFPVLMTAALLFGLVSGRISVILLRRIETHTHETLKALPRSTD
ncbi:MAG: Gx transporter family protein [Gammaproteobacteria bacterium]|nr:Gx transporter family protein [Gammaproteobacteria bacterium]